MNIFIDDKNGFESTAIGGWFLRGSFNDPKGKEGIHHLIEHLIFNNPTIANKVEKLKESGSIVNAFTSHEIMCLYCICLDDCFEMAMSLIKYVLEEDVFKDGIDKFDIEKMVVKKEIDYHHNYTEILKKHLLTQMFPDLGLNFSIMGYNSSVATISENDVVEVYQKMKSNIYKYITISGKKCDVQVYGDYDNNGKIYKELKIDILGSDFYINSTLEQHNYSYYGISKFFLAEERNFAQIYQSYIQKKLFYELREKRGITYRIDISNINISFGVVSMFIFKIPSLSIDVVNDVVASVFHDIPDLSEILIEEKQIYVKNKIKMDNVKSRMLSLGYDQSILLGQKDINLPIEQSIERLMKGNDYYRNIIGFGS